MRNDFDVSVFIITEYNEVMLPDEFDWQEDGCGMFVMITNDILNSDFGYNNSICIYRDWQDINLRIHNTNSLCDCRSQWSPDYDYIPNNEKYRIDVENPFNFEFTDPDKLDLYLTGFSDGYHSTMNIIKNVSNINKVQAVKDAYDIVVNFNNRHYHGYLPAIGQMIFINKNAKKINLALNIINELKTSGYMFYVIDKPTSKNDVWSSTEKDKNTSYCIDSLFRQTGCRQKDEYLDIIPSFQLF